jgi:uncharacterized pyridoxamine 5'-phosphate oxidase family protein
MRGDVAKIWFCSDTRKEQRQQILRVVGRAAVFNKVNLESELFKRETLYKNIHSPDHIVLTDRFFERYRKEVQPGAPKVS